MDIKTNFPTVGFSLIISILFHLYFLFFFSHSDFKFIEKRKNKITITLSSLGELDQNVEKKTIRKEKIISEKIPEKIKKKIKSNEKKEKKIDIKKIVPQKKSIKQTKTKNDELLGTLKGIEGGASKEIINQYITQVYKLIDSKKNYPRQSLIRREEGVVILQIIIGNDGKLISVKSLKAKYQRLVDSSFNAVEDASPFPIFPKEIKKNKMIIEVPVIYKIR